LGKYIIITRTREFVVTPKVATVERLKKRGGGYGCNSRPVRKVQNFGSALLHFYICHRFNIVSLRKP
jgi:hypothetical protein